MTNLTIITIISMLIMIVSKLLNIFRDACMAYIFGTSYIVDAYTLSYSVPSIIFSIFASGFAQSYIPCYMRVPAEKKISFFSNILTILCTFSLAFVIVFYYFSDNLVYMMAPGINNQTQILAVLFIKIAVMVLPFMVIFNILAAHSQSVERFVMLNFCNSILITAITIVAVMFSTVDTPEIIVYGDVVAEIIAICALWWYLKKKNCVSYRFEFDLHDDNFIKLCRMAIPLGGCILVDRINILVDRWFASDFGEGVISALSYADKVQVIPYSFVIALILSTCYPRISKAYSTHDNNTATYYVGKTLGLSLFITFPIMLLLVFFPEPIVEILYERGSFSSHSLQSTSICLSCYSFGIVFYALREIMSRILAANILQTVIFKNTVFSVVVNVILNYVLTLYLGYKGIALSTSITGALAFFLLSYEAIKRNLLIQKKFFYMDLFKIIISSLLTALLWYISGILSILSDGMLGIISKLMLAGLFYVAMCLLLRVKILGWVCAKKNRLFKKNKCF